MKKRKKIDLRRGGEVPLSLDYAPRRRRDGDSRGLHLAEASSPARESIQVEFAELVTVCMGELPESQRVIPAMRNVMNHSYDDIAAALNFEVGTMKSRIARARGQLRTIMAQKCPEFSEESRPSDWFEERRDPSRLLAGID